MRGSGHPSEEDYQKSWEALFTLSYILKFEIARKQMDINYKVNPVEVTWHLEKHNKKTTFTWEMMIMQPDFITEREVNRALQIAKDKRKNISADRVVYKKIEFGKCI